MFVTCFFFNHFGVCMLTTYVVIQKFGNRKTKKLYLAQKKKDFGKDNSMI